MVIHPSPAAMVIHPSPAAMATTVSASTPLAQCLTLLLYLAALWLWALRARAASE